MFDRTVISVIHIIPNLTANSCEVVDLLFSANVPLRKGILGVLPSLFRQAHCVLTLY